MARPLPAARQALPDPDGLAAARARGARRLRGARALAAHYDAGRDRVVVRLTNGLDVGFAPADAEGLAGAAAADLAVIEVEGQGLGLHFPRLDADLYVPALVRGLLGSARWSAARGASQRAVAGG